MIERTEELILNQIIHNKECFQKIYPHLKEEYFQDAVEKTIYKVIDDYAKEYSECPSIDTISLILNGLAGVSSDVVEYGNKYIANVLYEPSDVKNVDFVVNTAEEFCQEQAIYNAILDSMAIIQGEDKTRTKNALPDIMKDALRVSFNTNIGLDYEDVEERYKRLHSEEDKIPFDIEVLNIVTNGGFSKKTLNCILASTGIGKTLFMCHYASSCISQGKNVVYFTMEMAEERIAERIDANLMNVDLDDLKELEKNDYISRFKKVVSGFGFLSRMFGIKKKPKLGKLYIKEFPTATANMNHLRAVLDELKLKKSFVPDVIIIDYINICASTRLTASAGSYSYIKAIAEEMRGLAVEHDVPILTATQTNRGGFDSSDVDMTDTSESIGLPATLDFYMAFMTSDELNDMNLIAVKQLKNRYRDVNKNRHFVMGVDRPKMRFYHVKNWSGTKTKEDKVLMDDRVFGEDMPPLKPTKERFKGVKI
jgi:replicative DNA helicase